MSSRPIRPSRAGRCRISTIAPERAQRVASFAAAEAGQERVEQRLGDIDGAVRTAVTVEARDGRLCVFLPPVERLEDYLELVAAAEAAAEKVGLPVQIEGYPPPADPRINVIRVAPDPGVIEVNIHPSSSWRECVATTEAIYEEARLSRLGADKFMIDGKHSGTGGGNHVVVGGATPLDSPFLRRPDLLKSLIIHWLRHPSLSYFFSGLFIGPTSQAPRVDEARHDSLYELEIALAQIPRPGQGDAPRPWLLDRLMRNLLTDVTGNTHRAEICIDKLYSPDGADRPSRTDRVPRLRDAAGRAHEPRPAVAHPRDPLPPVARPARRAAAALGLVAARPVHAAAFRLGGFPRRARRSESAWASPSAPTGTRRRPNSVFRSAARSNTRASSSNCARRWSPGMCWARPARSAAPRATPTASTERLQVKLTTADPDRYVVACNRRRVPLRQTATEGVAVGAVRYKAWKPAMAMHPTVPVHAPLVLDIFDAWSGRALGGCVYHVAHPGGRSYDTFPVNSNEAEARRLARFEARGHTPGAYEPPPEAPHPEFPLTLDLRRPAGILRCEPTRGPHWPGALGGHTCVNSRMADAAVMTMSLRRGRQLHV